MSKYLPKTSAAAVICELNPMHKGHLRMLSLIRERMPDSVVCAVMSGDFVQRGECAVYDKYLRAELAVRHGFDLVLELPPPFSFGAAERFARGGVGMADALGVFTHLAFGCTPGNEDRLRSASGRMMSPGFEEKVKEKLSSHRSDPVSYVTAKGEAYFELYGEKMPESPNDILAVEYLSALKKLGSSVEPLFIGREGPWSASSARKMIKDGNTEALREALPDGFSPEGLTAADMDDAFPAVAYKLRNTPPEELRTYADVTDGMENLIASAARTSEDWDSLVKAVSGKKISAARARRTLLNCVIGVGEEDFGGIPPYTVLLAANRKGAGLLRAMKKNSAVKIVSRPAEADDRILTATEELYSLFFRPVREAGWAMKKRIYTE